MFLTQGSSLRRNLTRARYKLRGAAKKALPSALDAKIDDAEFELRLHRQLALDGRRFARHSGAREAPISDDRLVALITMDYHRLEKGMALRAPRRDFGQEVSARLTANLRVYSERPNADANLLSLAATVLEAHRQFGEVGPAVGPFAPSRDGQGGTVVVTRDYMREGLTDDPELFFMRRHSVRNFAPSPVDLALIERAVALAQRAPSVCNRQAGRVHLYRDPELVEQVLRHQNGNRGFGDQVGTLVVVTARLGEFVSIAERNQPWIDGGMFAVTMIWALHSLGLGTCALNCSLEVEDEIKLRAAAALPDDEAIITMIAVGNLPDEFRVAASQRIANERVLVRHSAA